MLILPSLALSQNPGQNPPAGPPPGHHAQLVSLFHWADAIPDGPFEDGDNLYINAEGSVWINQNAVQAGIFVIDVSMWIPVPPSIQILESDQNDANVLPGQSLPIMEDVNYIVPEGIPAHTIYTNASIYVVDTQQNIHFLDGKAGFFVRAQEV